MGKTFEELIEERSEVAFWNSKYNIVYSDNVLYLLKQVREATIKECEDIAFNTLAYQDCEDVRSELYNLPTDRIKTES